MAQTVVGFTIEIDGINSINSLNAAIADTKKEMNALDLTTEEGVKQFNELSQTLGKLTGQQKALKKAQDDVNKSFLEESSLGAYDKASAKLNRLRKEFKNAALDGSKSAEELKKLEREIQELDRTLKKVDGQVGQFQRNVGNYPRTFQRITRSLYSTIPGFEAFSSQLKTTEGGLSTFGKALIGGFVAFQAVKLVGAAMKRLDEFISKINETRQSVAEFSGAFGEDLDKLTVNTKALADTFDTDANTIGKAAEALSKQLGISFEEAIVKLEGALVEGQGNASDYLNSIAEFPATFKDASGSINEFSERNKDLLNTNKELASSQVEVAKKLQGANDAFKATGKAVETGLFLVFAKLIDIFKPVFNAFQKVGQAIGSIFSIFKTGNQEFSLFNTILEIITIPLKGLAFLLELAANGIAYMINGFRDFINQSPFLKAAFGVIGDIINSIIEGFSNLPIVFSASVEALKQLGKNFAIQLTMIKLDLDRLYYEALKLFGNNTQPLIEAIKKQQEALAKEFLDVNQAFNKAYDEQKKKQDAKREKEAEVANEKIIKRNQDISKGAEEAARKYADSVNKLTEERNKFLEKELEARKNTLALIAELQARYIEENIKNIKDDRERQLKEIQLNGENQIKALDEQLTKFQEENKKRLAEGQKQLEEAIKLQLGSKKIEQIRKENAKAVKDAADEEIAVASEIGKIKTEIVQQTETEISNAKAGFRKDDLTKEKEAVEALRDFRDKILNEELSYIDMVSEMRDLKNKETLNKLLKNETDAKKKEEFIRLAGEQETADKIANIRNQIQALDDAEIFLKQQAASGVEIKQEEYDAILLARQKLYTELSDIENKQTENVKKNSEEQFKERLDSYNEALNIIKDFTDVFFDALKVANERQQAALEADLERSQQRQDKLQEEIDNSTGLRRRFYEQQLEAEIINARKLEESKEDLAKKAAKQQKAQAILQSIINTALAVTSALATIPAPNVPAAILAGVLGAAQTAIIAAQPLAKGGVVGKGDEIVQFADGGRVTNRGNIKPLSNGDNVLATLKTGEVVLNQAQQKRIGYRALKAAKIPNFASGGLVGAPSGFLADQMNNISEEANRLNVMQKLIIETQNRIDRLQVVYTASTEDSVEKARNERKEIRVTAQI